MYLISVFKPTRTDFGCDVCFEPTHRTSTTIHNFFNNRSEPQKRRRRSNREKEKSSSFSSGDVRYWKPPSLSSQSDNGTTSYDCIAKPSSSSSSSSPSLPVEEAEGNAAAVLDSTMDVVPSLEDMAPFSSSFYEHCACFMVCAYDPTAVKTSSSSEEDEEEGNDTSSSTSFLSSSSFTNNNNNNKSNKPSIRTETSNPSTTTTTTPTTTTASFNPDSTTTTTPIVLSRSIDAVRATKIIVALAELNVCGGGGGGMVRGVSYRYQKRMPMMITTTERNGGNDDMEEGDTIMNHHHGRRKRKNDEDHDNHHHHRDDDDGDISFLDLVLHYSEDSSTIVVSTSYNNNNNTNINNGTTTKTKQPGKKKIPLLRSIFRHISSLPQLQSKIYTAARIYRTTTTNNHTTTTTTTTQEKLRHAERSQIYRTYLETSYRSHVDLIERLVGVLYERGGVNARIKVRGLMGKALLTFVRTSESGSSFGSGGGGGRFGVGTLGAFGVENTNAAGIDVLLRVLHRILRGVGAGRRTRREGVVDRFDDGDGDGGGDRYGDGDDVGGEEVGVGEGVGEGNETNNETGLHESLQTLLFEILLPLHKPSGMVLWRDQSPLLGLYHKTLVQCIATLLSRRRSCDNGTGNGDDIVGKVITSLLHPTVWPLEGGCGKGAAAAGNTPKVVLLLHEIDTYLGLLDLPDPPPLANTTDRTPSSASLPLAEATLPLVLRLSSCIASDNSRTSERALEFFRNHQFELLVRWHGGVVFVPLLRALCRVEHGMEVPWNPTVRKRTLLVLRDLQSYDKAVFRWSCEEMFRRRGMVAAGGDDNGCVSQKQKEKRKSCDGTLSRDEGNIDNNDEGNKDARASAVSFGSNRPTSGPTSDMISLKHAMGDWRPPPTTGERSLSSGTGMPPPKSRHPPGGKKQQAQPPSTVTGVAPWAMSSVGVSGTTARRRQPPSTVTGVAPWAVSGLGGGPKITRRSNDSLVVDTKQRGRLPSPFGGGVAPRTITTTDTGDRGGGTSVDLPKAIGGTEDAGRLVERDATGANTHVAVSPNSDVKHDNLSSPSTQNQAERKVLAFIESLKPPGSGTSSSTDEDGISSWARAQMSESPVLLPDLKFHDLVFGQTLGTGAFSKVRYARQIVRTTTRSNWPEYAVKIISTEKIKALNYSQSVSREIAVLHSLSHPGIARLISSFRFRDGAYLVLEYAAGGDLHSLLRKNGSLSVDSTRFVIGQIVAALASVHALGLVYGDLKPENVLVVESGHVKITDFGACRGCTKEAREGLRKKGKGLVRGLRDGDWRENGEEVGKVGEAENGNLEVGEGWLASPTKCASIKKEKNTEDEKKEEEEEREEDDRIEGTTAYLPPEVVLGSFPDQSADSWALGCVFFQCLSGRPPMIENDESSTRQKIVDFNVPSSDDTDDFFLERRGIRAFSSPSTIKPLIRNLLRHERTERPGMEAISHDAFFEGADVFVYHRTKSFRLDIGAVRARTSGGNGGGEGGEEEDAGWARRQFSSIWAPQPEAYDLGSGGGLGRNGISRGESSFGSEGVMGRNGPIVEGYEAGSPFLAGGGGFTSRDDRHRGAMLSKISEGSIRQM